MARRDTKIAVDIFPFLSVLCCMIGVLMLYIVAILSTRVIEAEDVARDSSQRARKTDGQEGTDEDQVDEETYAQLAKNIEDLERTVQDRRRARFELQAKVEQLQALIEGKQDELASQKLLAKRDPIKLDEPDPVRPVPDKNFSVAKEPIFIEIRADGYFVATEGHLFPTVEKRGNGDQEKYVASAELQGFIKEADAQRDRRYLLLLVHPNGIKTYYGFRRWLTQDFGEQKSRIVGVFKYTWVEPRLNLGVEPFSRDWQIISSKQPRDSE